MKHKVALLLPYFGTLPNYFPLWLKSAGANRDFTFMLFTDADLSGYNVPDNVKVIPMTLDGVKKLIAPHLDFEFSLKFPYKLCGYKPMYGLIFADWLKGYDFWGHVDPDVIWGDLRKFITDDIMETYGKIYRRGHLTIYRNTPQVNSYILHRQPFWKMSFEEIFRSDTQICTDEILTIEQLFIKYAGLPVYESLDFFDAGPISKQFSRTRNGKLDETVPAFRWKDGKLFGLSVNGKKENDSEYLYVHLQKRAMNFTPGLENEDSFMIIPNEFVKDHELTQEEITATMTPDPEYERAFREKYSRHGKGLLSRIKNFLSEDWVEKKNSICRCLTYLAGKKFYVYE